MDKNLVMNILFKFMRLVFGLFVFAFGTVCILNAAIGVAPWDVFHQGISNVTGITVGKANIYLGLIIIALDIYLGQDIGWATICNMLLIGTFIDILMINNIVPTFEGFLVNIIVLLIGMVIHGVGVFLYIGVGLGAGPRDGLMVVLTNKTGKPVGLVKSSIEVCAVAIGYFLGGNLGIGTLIMSFGSGPIWQYIFKLLNFNVSKVEHRFIKDDIKFIKDKFFSTN